MGRVEGRTSLHIERRIIDKPACVRCAESEVRNNSEKLADYLLSVRPDTDKWSENGGADKACHKQDGDLPFREGVLLAIERVDIWALEPIGTFGSRKDQHPPKMQIERTCP